MTAVPRNQEIVKEILSSVGLEKKEPHHHLNLKRASVLVPILFFDNQPPSILLTQRSQQVSSHKGEVCFPGGRQDPEDNGDDIQTALREAQEEVGLLSETAEPLCRLKTLESINHLCVTPIVAILRTKDAPDANSFLDKLTLSEQEVASAFLCPLQFFLQQDGLVESRSLEWSGETFIYRRYQYLAQGKEKSYQITGLTAHIAHQVAEILSTPQNQGAPFLSGYLWRQIPSESSNRKGYWTRKFFSLSHDNKTPLVLHQYDNEVQADRKGQSATKKNRLLLEQDFRLRHGLLGTSGLQEGKHPFQLSVLDGRVEWTLAAESKEECNRWVQGLLSLRETFNSRVGSEPIPTTL